MSFLRNKTVLVLEGAGELPQLAEAVPTGVRRAGGALAAARLLAELRPMALIVRAEIAWHSALVANLAPERRPAVLMTGWGGAVDPSLADEWFAEDCSASELRARLGLADARAKARRLAARRAFVDPLTGLPNRRALVRELIRDAERSRRTGVPLTLVLMDLDQFKQVNDLEGHPAGDRLLRRVGSELRHAVRTGEISGRIGGDEFAFVIHGSREDGELLIQRVLAGLRSIDVRASAAACTLRPGERLRDLYRRTDQALNDEKAAHRKRYLRHPDDGSAAQV